MSKRQCMKCRRGLYEGEGISDGICGDCGLAAMFGGMPDVVDVQKESGEPLTREMINTACKENGKRARDSKGM